MKRLKAAEIEANRICLTDGNGKARILLDAGDGNEPAVIALYSRSGKRTVNIMSKNGDSIEITLRGDAGLPYLTIEMDEQNQGSVMISDVKGLPKIILGANELTRLFQKEMSGMFAFHNGQLILTVPKE